MVTFNELRISEDGSCLIVDCGIEGVDIYKNMYIKDIWIDYYKNTTAASMPSEKAYCIFENDTDDKTRNHVRVSMQKSQLQLTKFGISSFEGGLFYVIVHCDGDLLTSVANLPCGYDETTKIGVIIDWRSFYERGMQYVSALYGACGQKNFCEYPAGFEDFIILWNSLKLAINTCNWDLVKTIWERILNLPENVIASGDGGYIPVSSGCGCRK